MSKLLKIKQLAEERIRSGGFNSFSFRDIANEIGIKSSSVHYHFATKEDLVVAVAEDYLQRFQRRLDQLDTVPDPKQALTDYVGLYRHTILEDGKMCLCCVLGAEASELPLSLQNKIAEFFQLNLNWLRGVFQRLFPEECAQQWEDRAATLLSQLQGSMVVSRAVDDTDVFNRVTNRIVSSCQ